MYYTPDNDTLGVHFKSVLDSREAPYFIKTSSLKECFPESTADLPDSAFADPILRQYPCHTKQATWLSYNYFVDNYEDVPEDVRERVKPRLVKHAEYFGILHDLQETADRQAAIFSKKAAYADVPDDCYLIVENGHKGLMVDAAGVEKAASWLIENRPNMTLENCGILAKRIVKRANALNYCVSPDKQEHLDRYLGLGESNKESMVRAVSARASFCKDAELANSLTKIATVLETAQDPTDAQLKKIAQLIDEIDVAGNLTLKRSRGEIEYPEEVFFKNSLTGLRKIASTTVRLQSGEVYSLDKMASLNRIDFESALGSDLADECFDDLAFQHKNAAAILPTLPRPDAERLGAFLKEQGIEPEGKVKAASLSIPKEYFDLYG